MWVSVVHFVIVYAIPFIMSLNRVGEYPSHEIRMKSMLIYWMIVVILLNIEQTIKFQHDYYFLIKSVFCYWIYNSTTNGAWFIFKKTNGLMGKGFNYETEPTVK